MLAQWRGIMQCLQRFYLLRKWALQKLLKIFQQKILAYNVFEILTFEILTKG